jgi:hypothetical protein
MSKSFVQINGQVFDYASLTVPASGRAFRNAWTTPVNGVVQVDMDAARAIQKEKVKQELIKEWHDAGGPLSDGISPADKQLAAAPELDAAADEVELRGLDLAALRSARGG